MIYYYTRGEAMTESVSIAAIGTSDSVILFNAIGIKTYVIKEIEEVDRIVYELYKAGCKIIYFDEEIYDNISDVIEKYTYQTYPILLPLPMNGESKEVGLKKIKNNVEKAIGINIF